MDASSGSREPGYVQAMDRITDNPTKITNAKISTVLEAIKEQTSQLQWVATWIGKVEKWIADVEAAATSLEVKLTHLLKKMHDMQEHR